MAELHKISRKCSSHMLLLEKNEKRDGHLQIWETTRHLVDKRLFHSQRISAGGGGATTCKLNNRPTYYFL